MVLDFLPNLQEYVNNLELPYSCRLGEENETECLYLYPVTGGETVRNYYNGVVDKLVRFRFLIKSNNVLSSCDILNKIMSESEMLEDLPSKNGSYEFHYIKAIAPPYQMAKKENEVLAYALIIEAKLTIYY